MVDLALQHGGLEPSDRPASGRWVRVAVTVWLLAAITGMALVWRYKATPGTPADAPAQWPAPSAIPRTPGRPQLVMFAHPECPCTRASLEELSVIMSRVRGKVDASVLFIRPRGVEAGWEDTATRRRAEAIPGVSVRVDVDGREAERFGARVSGQVVLYDETGVLRFAGGITGVRGHVGDNIGRQRLLSFIDSHRADAPTSHVFGCDLF
jgi:hypothetical protein